MRLLLRKNEMLVFSAKRKSNCISFSLMGEIECFYSWLIKHKNLSQLAGLTGTPEELKA